ncbi:MAG: isopentenyl-diphosphate Delta-isomerase [Humibacillus sp.]|nr:isopentenyl-diphosphate Delta-isomerase [Humibacillus sp.]MDN5776623.1 isopentenyl-diphosphate Delta-isomerase [Humibacillus sp.]
MTDLLDQAAPTAPEVVVLLADDGAAIGTAAKSGVHHAATPLHLGFSCYLFDHDGDLLVTRRASDKATFPGVLTNSVCGHPAPGESLADAVRRRAHRELGIAVDDVVDVRLVLADFAYRAQMNDVVENELCPVLVARLREGASVEPDAAEVGWHGRVDWVGFAADVIAGRVDVSPWCATQVAALHELGPVPSQWPDADPSDLPAAVVLGRAAV